MDTKLKEQLTDIWLQSLRLPRQIEKVKDELLELFKIANELEASMENIQRIYKNKELE